MVGMQLTLVLQLCFYVSQNLRFHFLPSDLSIQSTELSHLQFSHFTLFQPQFMPLCLSFESKNLIMNLSLPPLILHSVVTIAEVIFLKPESALW